MRRCTIDGCREKHLARGYCRLHYRRFILGQKPHPQGAEAMRADPTDPRHGTHAAYLNLKCRCDRCRRANAEARKAYLDRDPSRRVKHNIEQAERARRKRAEP